MKLQIKNAVVGPVGLSNEKCNLVSLEAKSQFVISITIIITLANLVTFASAQTLVPGIHGMSTVQGVRFTWIIISSDNELSVNVRYNETSATPPVLITATALTNPAKSN